MEFNAKVIADSIAQSGPRIITMELCYPRLIHSELMTHRVFSRNAASSRAIPVKKMIEQVRDNPAMPIHFGANQPGMQADQELSSVGIASAKYLWMKAAKNAADVAEQMNTLGVHKQVANRILEPFQWMKTIVTATAWKNFFELRDHRDAEPNIRFLAQLMKAAIEKSNPQYLDYCQWHIPYLTQSVDSRRNQVFFAGGIASGKILTIEEAIKCSVARCARVSYLTHDNASPSLEKDIELHDRLVGSTPIHASPAEHQATPLRDAHYENLQGNFRGWQQYRKYLETGISL